MKYRILTDGNKFRVQRWGFFRWTNLTQYTSCCPMVFSNGLFMDRVIFVNEKLAEQAVRERYGTSAVRIREWRTV